MKNTLLIAPDRSSWASRHLVEIVLGLCLAFAAGVAVGQGQSLSVLVTDDSGAPLPESLVVIQDDSGQGPAPVQTGEDGRASFELSAGEWQVDVRREGFMIYTGYVSLEAGKRPELGFSSRQRTGSFWAPLRVSFSGGGTDAVFAASRKEEKEARKREEQRLKSQERAERRASRGNLARIKDQEEPARAASPEPEPVPESRPKPAPEVSEVAIPEPEEVDRDREVGKAATQVVPSESSQLLPESTPEPEKSLPEREQAAAAPAVDRLRSLDTNPRLLRAGACRECQPGEWALLAKVEAAPRNAVRSSGSGRPADVCTPGAGKAFSEIADLIAENLAPELWTFAGQLRSADGNDLLRLVDPEVAASIERLLSQLVIGAESCPVVAAILPAGSKYVGYRYRVAEGKRESDCRSTDECQIGEAKWRSDPGVERRDFGILIHSQFENSSRKNARQAELRVYFVPPSGWLPPN